MAAPPRERSEAVFGAGPHQRAASRGVAELPVVLAELHQRAGAELEFAVNYPDDYPEPQVLAPLLVHLLHSRVVHTVSLTGNKKPNKKKLEKPVYKPTSQNQLGEKNNVKRPGFMHEDLQ